MGIHYPKRLSTLACVSQVKSQWTVVLFSVYLAGVNKVATVLSVQKLNSSSIDRCSYEYTFMFESFATSDSLRFSILPKNLNGNLNES